MKERIQHQSFSFYGTVMLLMVSFTTLCAQSGSKIVRKTGQMESKSQTLQTDSEELQKKVEGTTHNIKSTASNVKKILSIFDPIIYFHSRKRVVEDGIPSESEYANDSTSSDTNFPTEGGSNDVSDTEVQDPDGSSDATTMLGSQNHKEFGCYLDLGTGTVLDDIDAAENTSRVDLIFAATDYFGSALMYAFLSPATVKSDAFAHYYFRGSKYKDQHIPVRQWEEANESEMAMTSLTLSQFEKINSNKQLMAVVQQISGFKDRLESRSKLTGKIIACKTEIQSRTVYALIAVLDHYGNHGSNGCLKIKIKLSGIDLNGDSIPDPDAYLK